MIQWNDWVFNQLSLCWTELLLSHLLNKTLQSWRHAWSDIFLYLEMMVLALILFPTRESSQCKLRIAWRNLAIATRIAITASAVRRVFMWCTACQRRLLVLEYSWRLLARITGRDKTDRKKHRGTGTTSCLLPRSVFIPRAFLSFAWRQPRSRTAKLNKTICSKANNGIRFTCE